MTAATGPMDPQSLLTPEVTRAVTRGTARMFEALGHGVVTEVSLANGRRADLVTLASDGTISIVEVKSGLADYLSDRKWVDYGDFCDRFYFAVADAFPTERLPPPEQCGLIIADAWDAEITRPAPETKLAAARRKAMTLRVARTAAQRLRQFQDPRI